MREFVCAEKPIFAALETLKTPMTNTQSASSVIKKTEIQILLLNRIKQLRINRGFSQLQMADLLNVTNGQIGNIESLRQSHKYTLAQIKKICEEFNVSIAELFTGKENCTCEELVEEIVKYEESKVDSKE